MTNIIFTIGALSVRADGTYAPFSPEAWKYAGEMTLIGMGMIFAVLAILWAVLAIFKLIFAKDSAPKSVPAPKQETKPAPAPAPVSVTASDDRELVAVITAAIAAYRAEEGSANIGGFRVVSFRRVRNTRK